MTKGEPLRQGELDNLCGLYAILNAAKCAGVDLDKKDRKRAFAHMLRFCDYQWGLVTIIRNGTRRKQLRQLLGAANGVLMKRKNVILRSDRPLNKHDDLETLWKAIKKHIESSESNTVIIGTGGNLHHWTVVERMSENQMKLCDSDSRKHLNKKALISGKTTVNPREVFFVTAVSLGDVQR